MENMFEKDYDETWLDALIKQASKWGLEDDAEESYRQRIAEGYSESDAAWMSAYDWDILPEESPKELGDEDSTDTYDQ